MVDIQTVSIAIASASVVIGVIYYILQISHQSKVRKTDLVTGLSRDIALDKEALDAYVDIVDSKFDDYDDFVKKYGKLISKNQVPRSFMMMGNFYEQIGVLLSNKLIDASLVDQLFPVCATYEKMKPVINGMREEYHESSFFEWFEYLYNETKKREQKLQPKGV